MIIDLPGHHTTEQKALDAFRDHQLVGVVDRPFPWLIWRFRPQPSTAFSAGFSDCATNRGFKTGSVTVEYAGNLELTNRGLILFEPIMQTLAAVEAELSKTVEFRVSLLQRIAARRKRLY